MCTFATVAHGQLALTEQGAAVRLANAGHPPPLVLGQGPAAPVQARGTLLGVNPDVALTEVAFELRSGEMLVLYTDGVTEARSVDGFYGAERLMTMVGSVEHPCAEAVAAALLTDVETFQHGRLRDDIAILVIEATP